MIDVVQSDQFVTRADHLRQMFELRARIFYDRLGWDVQVKDGREHDRFDECHPLYLIALDANNKVVGSARLLPTTGPNMLQDVFSDLLPAGQSIRSPLIWESTRFCVDMNAASDRTPEGLSKVSGELMAAEIELGLVVGLSHIVTVVDVGMERILRRSRCGFDRIGKPVRFGRVLTVAGLIEVSEAVLANIRSVHGISQRCVELEQVAPVAIAA
jgi:acyl homoserine lactone synthase